MSRLWSHPAYAEDQKYSAAILTTHVLFRGFQTGAMIGPIIGSVRYILRLRHQAVPPTFFSTIVRSSGLGAAIGTGALSVALVGRMWGREDIEWKDRAWRLLENKGQVEVDTWAVGGMALGGALLAVRKGVQGVGWRMGAGSLGLGGTMGVFGYVIWRHGVKGGKWPENVQ